MAQAHLTLPLAGLILAQAAAPIAAQQTPAPKPTSPATISTNSGSKSETGASSDASVKIERSLHKTWDQTKSMTRKEWNAAKRKWASEKGKWRDCNKQAEAEKLAAPKSWSFVAGCMTRS